jgi:hypothetical protein
MKDTGLRKKLVSQLFDPAPGHPILLAPTSERAAPKIGDAMPECVQCTTWSAPRGMQRSLDVESNVPLDSQSESQRWFGPAPATDIPTRISRLRDFRAGPLI